MRKKNIASIITSFQGKSTELSAKYRNEGNNLFFRPHKKPENSTIIQQKYSFCPQKVC